MTSTPLTLTCIAALALGWGVPASATAIAQPTLVSIVMGDGSVRPVEVRLVDGPGDVVGFSSDWLYLHGDGSVRNACGTDAVCDGSVRIEGQYKTDPFIEWALSVVDFGAATTFSFQFAVPTVGGPYSLGTHTLGGTFSRPALNVLATAATGADGGSLADHPALTLSDSDCPDSSVCDALGTVDAAGAYATGFLVSRLVFTGAGADPNGSGAEYSFNGRFEIGNGSVPEPGVPLLLAAALLAARRARRPARSGTAAPQP